ncbi:MAG: radical SAM family heme chaperone HemW [Oscillospiraceae bacterium]|nr:radical SAM family heme chaperone HemW [Oscillospiraceae bacterium]
MQGMELYIHVPFCMGKCPYCDFYSKTPTPEQVGAYTQALLRGLRHLPPNAAGRRLDTVYFGGGTPNLLGAENLCAVLDQVGKVFALAPGAEITCEANPGSITAQELMELRRGGFNRLSLGLQSSHPEELALLGRKHTPRDVAQAVADARKAGFENLSLDLMLGTPGQTVQSAKESVDFCARLGVEHISAYLLKVELGTPYGKNHMEERIPDDDGMADLYLQVSEHLEQQGYKQYEISNYAREGHISRHNTGYWLGKEYIGLGPAAHSLWQGGRYSFPRDLQGFVEAENPFALWQQDGEGDTREEFIMLRLRLAEGFDLEELEVRWPEAAEENQHLKRQLPALEKAGLVKVEGNRLRLTRQGFLVSNGIIARLI